MVPGGTGIDWSAPRVPEPERYVDEKLRNWANVHAGSVTVFLRGRLDGGADTADLRLEVDGLTCSTIDHSCMRLHQVLESSGEGPDEIFAAFPTDWR